MILLQTSALLLLLFSSIHFIVVVDAWVPIPLLPTRMMTTATRGGRYYRLYQQQPPDAFIDAEIEPSTTTSATTTALDDDDDDEMSLLDMALSSTVAAASDLKDVRIPFLDYQSLRDDGAPASIDTKVALMIEIDQVQYGIGVPYDAAAVVVVVAQGGDGTNTTTTTRIVTPDGSSHEDTDELLELMAGRLQEMVGKDLRLLRTPRYLTIAGPLDKYTKNWQDHVLREDSAMTATQLLDALHAADAEAGGSGDNNNNDDDDEGLEFFYDFMKKELGEEEFAKAMADDDDDDTTDLLTPEMLDLFNMPEITDESLANPEEDWEFAREKLGMDKNFGLMLVSFRLKDKTYALAKLMQPVTLVAKHMGDDKFDMLRPEEEELLFPQIEQKFHEELENAGLKLRP